MSTSKRVDEYTIEIGIQADIETAAASLTAGEILPPDVSSVGRAEVEDPTVARNGVARPSIPGVYYEATAPSASMLAKGQGAARTASPTVTAQDIAVAAVFQSTPDEMTGSTAEAGATVSSVVEADAGNHAPASISGITTPIVLAPFYVTSLGRTFLRPATYATDTFTLLAPLPAVPSEGDKVYGCINIQYNHDSFSTIPCPVEVRFPGLAQIQNKRLIGSVASLSIPEVGSSGIPQLDFGFKSALGITNADITAASVSPDYKGRVFAGGEILLGVTGNAPSSVCSTFSAALREGEFGPSECPGKTFTISGTTYDVGMDDWIPPKEIGTVNLVVPESTIPSDLTGGSGDTWEEAWADYRDQTYHLLVSFGQGRAGELCGFYFQDMVLANRPEMGATKNDLGARGLTFRPSFVVYCEA